MRIGRFENHRAVEALHLGEVGLGKNMSLKVDDHDYCFTSSDST